MMPFLIVALVVLAMEAWSWFSHKYLLHGPLWFLHKSHHQKAPTWWEWNDLVVVFYGLISTALVIYGLSFQSPTLWIGVGIGVYGILYFLLHDVVIHRRVRTRYQPGHPYILRLIRAHRAHHRHIEKDESEAFGFLYAIRKYRVSPDKVRVWHKDEAQD